MLCRARFVFFLCTPFAALVLAWSLHAAEPEVAAPVVVKEDGLSEVVELFAGIEAGNIGAKVFPRSEKHVNLLLENKRSEPVVVSVPAAVGVVPVMAQLQPFPWPDQQDQGQQKPQDVAAAPPWQVGPNRGNPGRGNPWNVPGAALFSVPPESTVKVGLTGMCLNHGQPSPRPKLSYELRPIHEVAIRPEVAALCAMLGKGEVDQTTAQLAAWHFQNKMSWEDLAAISKKTAIGPRSKYTPEQIQAAKKIASAAEKLAKEMQSPETSASAMSMR